MAAKKISPSPPPSTVNRRAILPPPAPPRPVYRYLRGYSFDPSVATRLETALVSRVTFRIPWEPSLKPGPVGEYLEVVDYDPASGCYYAPVNLDDPIVLAQNGINPSEGNPQFHQQMVYAVAMTTINNFERALGRPALWSDRQTRDSEGFEDHYVQRLRIYPHALREANAYYSPDKKALLFGYFPASGDKTLGQFPGGMVFTCLSHDVIAHETAHALLDGFHEHFLEPTNQDVLAFHEAFADIVALFQHFTFPDVLAHQIAKTRGDLAGSENLLGQLATQFGHAMGNYGALRDAIGKYDPVSRRWTPHQIDPSELEQTSEPHDRGAILVAAVFDAFISIYRARTRDLVRIASGGTGVLSQGDLHPDLVKRLAAEAAKAAGHVLGMCIRALDYCPPVDLTFGEFLRALITADTDLVPDDHHGYRIAFIEAFRRRGIFPENVRTMSADSLCWPLVPTELEASETNEILEPLFEELRAVADDLHYTRDRQVIWKTSRNARAEIHTIIRRHFDKGQLLEKITGLSLTDERIPEGVRTRRGDPVFEVHAIRESRRLRDNDRFLNQVFITLLQKKKCWVTLPNGSEESASVRFGCTLVLDLDEMRISYAIRKELTDENRVRRIVDFENGGTGSAFATYFCGGEPFAALHRHHEA